jgi:amino acid permease
MFGTSIYSLASDVPLNSKLEHWDEVPFSLSILFLCIPMIKFTIGFQNIIPSALQYMRNKKVNSNLVIISASVVGTILIMVLGLATGSALKNYKIPTLSTLAWRGYDAGISPRPFWTYAVEYIIIIFPALNVLTSYPPNSIAFSENLDAYLKAQFKIKSMKYSLRFIIWIPVLIICLLFDNLGKCASAAALTSYFTVYITVCLMLLISKKYVPYKSPFEGWHSSSSLAWSIFYYSSFLLVINTGYLIFT